MKAIDVIRMALETGDQITLQLIEDMRTAPLAQPTPRGGNHPLWVLGHLAIAEGILHQAVLGQPNPIEHWMPLFGPGSEPVADLAAYPGFDEVLRTYRELRSQNMSLLDAIGDGGLDSPANAPLPGLEEVFRTVGQSFLTTALHQMNHRGQVADARRAAGRKPVFALPGTVAD